MGILNSKEFMGKKKIDEATSNSSLSNIRYVITEKPKWIVFRKKEITAIPAYRATTKPMKGCPCGNNGPCKQKITPNGVTIHYPQKKKKFSSTFGTKSRRFMQTKVEKGYHGNNSRKTAKVKVIRERKFPTWRLDKICYRPHYSPVAIRPRLYQ